MIFFEVSNVDTFNYFASIFLNLAIYTSPIFGALALTRH